MIVKPGRDGGDLRLDERGTAAGADRGQQSGHRRLTSVVPGCSSGSVVCERASASSRAIGGESARAPSESRSRPATHQPR